MRTFEGDLDGRGLKVVVLWSRFNSEIGTLLLEGARAELARLGVEDDAIELITVPGAFELPAAAARRLAGPPFDAAVALGVVIRGETSHYEIVAGECARGLAELSRATGVPVAFGVLTTENEAQALERADPARQNKGAEAARVAVEMAALHARIARAGASEEEAARG